MRTLNKVKKRYNKSNERGEEKWEGMKSEKTN
jgi:hypothetical protein